MIKKKSSEEPSIYNKSEDQLAAKIHQEPVVKDNTFQIKAENELLAPAIKLELLPPKKDAVADTLAESITLKDFSGEQDIEEKNKVESILFAVGKKIGITEMQRLSNLDTSNLKKCLNRLRLEYDERKSPLMIIEEGGEWKVTVREKYLEIVRKIVPRTEMNKSVMETLAIIAWKFPLLQSELIHIRTNKAYDHVAELETIGFIVKERRGRSYLLKLTQKFFEYFDVSGRDDLQRILRQEIDFDRIKSGVSKEKKIGKLDVYDVKEPPKERPLESFAENREPVEFNSTFKSDNPILRELKEALNKDETSDIRDVAEQKRQRLKEQLFTKKERKHRIKTIKAIKTETAETNDLKPLPDSEQQAKKEILKEKEDIKKQKEQKKPKKNKNQKKQKEQKEPKEQIEKDLQNQAK